MSKLIINMGKKGIEEKKSKIMSTMGGVKKEIDDTKLKLIINMGRKKEKKEENNIREIFKSRDEKEIREILIKEINENTKKANGKIGILNSKQKEYIKILEMILDWLKNKPLLSSPTLLRICVSNRIKQNKKYIEDVVKPLAEKNKQTISYTIKHEKADRYADFDTFASRYSVYANKYYVGENGYMQPPVSSGSSILLDTGLNRINYREIFLKNPMKEKFYHSFKLDTIEKQKMAAKYFDEIVEECKTQKIPLSRKSETNAYDSLIFYSHSPRKLENIIKKIYEKYKKSGIFCDSYHWFQGEIEGINPKHIGNADEPGWYSPSHSGRMSIVGENLDKGLSYEESCSKIGVKPEEPSKIDIKKRFVEKYYKNLYKKIWGLEKMLQA